MDSVTLGKRIKEARLAKKMTQSDVVGGFITRNMLSQIESGTATPSIKTLEYLAGVLDIPMDQLIGERSEDALSRLAEAKGLLIRAEYEALIEMDGSYPGELADEFKALLGRAYLELAKQRAEQGEFQEVAGLVKKSIEYSDLGVYANHGLKTEGLLFLNQVAERLSHYYMELSHQNHN